EPVGRGLLAQLTRHDRGFQDVGRVLFVVESRGTGGMLSQPDLEIDRRRRAFDLCHIAQALVSSEKSWLNDSLNAADATPCRSKLKGCENPAYTRVSTRRPAHHRSTCKLVLTCSV